MINENASLIHIPDEKPNAAQRLTKFLAPYKELITILMFFAGGAVWIVAFFATKSQLKELRCFARESVTVTRAELTLRTTFDDIVSVTDKVANLEQKKKDIKLTDAESLELRKSMRDLDDLKARREISRKRFEEAEKKLLDGKCSAETNE